MKKNRSLVQTFTASLMSAVCVAPWICAPLALAQSPVIKVDLNMSGRPEAEVNEPGYLPWEVMGAPSVSKTFDGVTVTFARQGANGLGLKSDWWKAGVQTPYYARLPSDGITVEEGTAGGSILMSLSGLPAGNHTLLVYLNNTSNADASLFAPIDISANGTLKFNNFVTSARATTNADAKTAYLTFTANGGKAEILFTADTNTGASNKNLIINGFELNTPNSVNQAASPNPLDGDQHVNADTGSYTLSWVKAATAVSHNLYVATSEAELASATTSSSAYKGNQTATSYSLKNLYSRTLYYWRVDEVDANGNITQGDVWTFRPRQLAFPSAEGYGRFAIGGRGGIVVKVTNLNDSGAGSFREAVTKDIGPRTIIFDVSGVIALESRLVLNHRFVTVAGQTAPGKGITLRKAPFGLSGAEDAVVRHMRVRVGGGPTFDGMGMSGSDNSIIDHSSISWTIDEAFSSRSGKNITLQRTFISECLNAAGHQNYPAGTQHGYAASISGDVGSFHHNLLAHCEGRNWSLAGGLDGDGNYAGRLDIFNNVVYNWDKRTADGGAHEVNFVNNYYKPGPATSYFYALNAQYDSFPGTQRYYVAGNEMPGHCSASNQTACRTYNGTPNGYSPWVTTPFFPSYATIHSALDAYKSVLSDVGNNQPVFDDHDVRVVNETLNGNYKYSGSYTGKKGLPDDEDDVGGYENYPTEFRPNGWDSDNDGLPDWWETYHGLNRFSAAGDFSDANNDADKNGFTQLDDYLEWMANPHYSVGFGSPVTVNLPATFRGYTASPVYTASNAVGGKVAVSSNSATFTPSGCGLASFNLTVKDSAGATMTRKVGVFVDAQVAGACTGSGSASTSSAASSVPSGEPTGVMFDVNSAGFCSDATLVEFDRAGYSGNGYFNSANAVGAALVFDVVAPEAGNYDLNFRFANGGTAARSGNLVVNGVARATLTLAVTGAWENWQQEGATVALNAGENKIELVAVLADGLANIDYLDVTGNVSAGNCSFTPSSAPASSSSLATSSAVSVSSAISSSAHVSSQNQIISSSGAVSSSSSSAPVIKLGALNWPWLLLLFGAIFIRRAKK